MLLASLLVLKLPRSGSSFFASLLSQQDGVWLVPQLIRPNHVPDASETLQLLTKALDQPYKAKKDDVAALQARNGGVTPIVGYSINPLSNASSTFIDATTLRAVLLPRKTNVVLYQRTNIVKQAIATMRGACLSKKCGFNNRINTDEAPFWTKSHVLLHGVNSIHDASCSIGEQHVYPIDMLKCSIVWHAEAYSTLHKFATAITNNNFLVVSYEDLQRDAESTLRRLFGILDSSGGSGGGRARQLKTRQFLSKHTSDDLRRTVGNFDELVRALDDGDNGGCLKRMLFDTTASAFDACQPPTAWRSQCAALLAQPKSDFGQCVLNE